MVINLRGTSGSGKTTIVRGIMAKASQINPMFFTGTGFIEVVGKEKKPDGYRMYLDGKPSVYAIGSYENTCGGCDAISSQDEICDRIRRYAPHGHVLVEGLLMSHLFSRYAMLDRELHAKGIDFVWAFIDTPLELCLQRVEARREERRLAKKNPPEYKPLDPTNTVDKWNDMRRVHKKCVSADPKDWKKVVGYTPVKLDARWIDHQNAVEQVYGWL